MLCLVPLQETVQKRLLGPNIAKHTHDATLASMKTQTLNVSLTAELRRYVTEQVRTGRYQNEDEVVRDAIRQMQQREMEQFERLFDAYPGAPPGEPTSDDDQVIQTAIKRHRDAKPVGIGRKQNRRGLPSPILFKKRF